MKNFCFLLNAVYLRSAVISKRFAAYKKRDAMGDNFLNRVALGPELGMSRRRRTVRLCCARPKAPRRIILQSRRATATLTSPVNIGVPAR